MCGIAGIYGIGDKASFHEACSALSGMVDRIAHRGPDASGVWMEEDEVIFGHRRLSIIDTRDAANQPFVDSSTGDVLIFNGEVYNYRELKEQLSGSYVFKTDSDTEVVLAALQQWGRSALQEFNGMFAFAYWNHANREVLIARDRIGIKPVYYTHARGAVLFSSEIRSLLASGWVKRNMSPEALADYLRYQTVHAPLTMVQDVFLLEPGHWLRLHGEETEKGCWWDVASLSVDEIGSNISRAEHLKMIREKLERSVDLRLRSDVPLGAFLSGGIDSSAIVGLMSAATEQRISTFSVTFNEGDYDESPYSRLIAQKFDTDHHEIRLTPEAFLKEIPSALDALDHPSGDGPNTYVVSQATKNAGITVALSGLGGDELFAGYPVFKRTSELWERRWLGSWPRGMRKLIGSLYTLRNQDANARKKAEILAGNYFDVQHTYPLSRQVFLEGDIRKLSPNSSSYPNAVFQWLNATLDQNSPGSKLPRLSKVSLAEMWTYMGHTLLRDTDQMSMAHALEVRVPFLDHNVVLAAMRVSDEEKWPHTPKQLLTEALPDLLPDEVIHRPKMGFTLPWEMWMRNELKALCESGLGHLKGSSLMESDEIDRIWNAFLARDRRWSYSRIWPLVVLGYWMERNGIH
ncbi:MAG: asparagine synthase (glutamine-hydrolyzing) [Flavobacteriales bacterium]